MPTRLLLVAALASIAFPLTAQAEERGLFVGLKLLGGTAFGSSSTTDGGAPWAGGGIVSDVRFGETVGIDGRFGYRFDRAMSAFISYQHIRGDIRWNANFPLFGVSSRFAGSAISNAILGNVSRELHLSDTTAVIATAGLGITFNALSGVTETDRATGIFLADVEDHTRLGPIAQIGIGLRHRITSNAVLVLDGSIAYTSGFETGNTRHGNLGITGITPYKIDDVWRANIGASIRYEL